MAVSKVELYAAIRRDARTGMSGRALERKYNVGRRTIVKAIASAWSEPRKALPRRASRLDPFNRSSRTCSARIWTRRASSGTRSSAWSTG